jgi:beta-1,2-mannobiose phosphorylase / 1,2-beta-oligomannan phosphorylase
MPGWIQSGQFGFSALIQNNQNSYILNINLNQSKMKNKYLLYVILFICITGTNCKKKENSKCTGGWVKYEHNPVLGGNLGTIFDISVLKTDTGVFRMYCSWRDKKSIAISESKDGLKWSEPVVCLSSIDTSKWEEDVNRPVVIKKDSIYHMWYTGQFGGADGNSWIGYAVSNDGKIWTRKSDKPVLSPEAPWEKVAVMCPHVIWDDQEKLFKMWYSAGGQWEPDAIGYATSKDGLNWEKYKNNPVLSSDKHNKWEEAKVTGCQVIKRQDDYLMFYIGFKNSEVGQIAQIGMARSKDGITNWIRFKENPLIIPGPGWDATSVYKPYAVPDTDNNRWLLYYNGRDDLQEQIGIAIHEGLDLGFKSGE